MKIDIQKAARRDTPVLRQLYELYCHDFSEYTQSDVADNGMYTDDGFLKDAWPNRNWSAWLARVDDRLAGFAWVRFGSLFRPEDPQTRQLDAAGLLAGDHALIEEFFVMRKYRRRGVGAAVAQRLFERFNGVWEVSEMIENTPAQAFCRTVIDRYTGGKYIEVVLDTELWRGPVQVFRNPVNNSDSRNPAELRSA